ncbi:transcriptional regulator [Mycobacterium leprae Kyoto-2]|uniref:Transcriptional regulator n=3 Tax=Mycobacterium leprae TaxID=1769 RepID=Q9CBN3_MYCLE|nr:class I SAM-dependent methyltransferase [Mycobacterium leprae]OAR19912.1 methyltransferase [Mycobacterium leprae 3125609]OAX72191.1 methyltransferase [Mycobacterium leprae 7935681]CAR71878.1 putative transcriptional regulator [Mycobacterium leprae Br4923]BBC17376.1 transcriptional regulator [Mycobacterium leprae Kyoto-2]
MVGLSLVTSTQIAYVAGLNERYVREWLGDMTTGHVVDYYAETGTYSLSVHRVAVLVWATGTNNLASVAQFIPLFSGFEQQFIGGFCDDVGGPYSEFPRFYSLMAEMSGAMFDAAFVDVVLPLANGLPERLRSGAGVADFDCGSGHVVNVLVRAFPASWFIGIDFSNEAVAIHTAEEDRLGLGTVTFESHNLARLDKAAAYDVITVFDASHDHAQPVRVLENIYQALRPGDVLLMASIKVSSQLEDNVDVLMSIYLYTASLMHCMTVSLALQGAPDWMRCGEGGWPPRCSATRDWTTCGWSISSPTRSTTTYIYIATKLPRLT